MSTTFARAFSLVPRRLGAAIKVSRSRFADVRVCRLNFARQNFGMQSASEIFYQRDSPATDEMQRFLNAESEIAVWKRKPNWFGVRPSIIDPCICMWYNVCVKNRFFCSKYGIDEAIDMIDRCVDRLLKASAQGITSRIIVTATWMAGTSSPENPSLQSEIHYNRLVIFQG